MTAESTTTGTGPIAPTATSREPGSPEAGPLTGKHSRGPLIDHLVYAAPDLAAAVDDLEWVLGVAAAAGGRHPDLGTHNALLGLGAGRYLEVIAPDPSLPDPAFGRPFGLDGLEAARLAGWALRTTGIDDAVARARAAGFDPGDPVDARRRAPTGGTLEWRLTLNALGGGPVPFLIDWGDTPHPSRDAPAGLTLVSLRIEDPDPASVTAALRALGAGAEADVSEGPTPALVATVDGPRGHHDLR